MRTNDTILQQYILQDIRIKNIDNYTIEDEVLVAPKRIEVKGNEIVYLAHYQTRQSGNFKTQFESGMESFWFETDNTSVFIHVDAGTHYYESGLVKRFRSDIEIIHTGAPKFYIRIVRLTILDKTPHEKG
jgi:hypothetical protein